MALITSSEIPELGVAVPAAYTNVSEIKVTSSPWFSAPDVEGGAPTILSKHTLSFRTLTWASAVAKEKGLSPVQSHGYTLPYEYGQENVLATAYAYLKSNVGMFKSAQDA